MNRITAVNQVIHKVYPADVDVFRHCDAHMLFECGANVIFAVIKMFRNAEYMVTAISGRGVVMNNGGASGYTFPDIYPELDIYNKPGTLYDFPLQREPDVIVINLGTNDATNENLDVAVFQAGVVDFIELVREKNPNAQIIWAYGLRTDKRTTDVANAIQAAITQVGDAKVHYLALAVAEEMHLNHPTAAAYEPSGNLLIQKINEITSAAAAA